MTVTAKERVISYLSKSKTLTAAQMTSKFGVTNPASLVSRLRNEGYAIYNNSRVKNGKRVNFYRLGTPSVSMLDSFAARGITPQTT